MTRLELGKKYKAEMVRHGTGTKGEYLFIRTRGTHSDSDKNYWTLFVDPIVEINEGGTFKITEWRSAEWYANKQNGHWNRILQHHVSIEVITKGVTEHPDDFGGFDFSEPEEEELTLPY